MENLVETHPFFVRCVDCDRYTDRLVVGKDYELLSWEEGLVRVVDETSSSHLYDPSRFALITETLRAAEPLGLADVDHITHSPIRAEAANHLDSPGDEKIEGRQKPVVFTEGALRDLGVVNYDV